MSSTIVEQTDDDKKDQEIDALLLVDTEDIYTAIKGHCPVCLKELVNGVLVEECLHEFCETCIHKWVDHLRSREAAVRCPICRRVFTRLFTNIRSENDFEIEDLEGPPLPLVIRRRGLVYRRQPYDLKAINQHTWPPILKTNAQGRDWIERELGIVLGTMTDVTLLAQIVYTFLNTAREENNPKKRKRSQSSCGYHRMITALQDFLFDKTATFVVEVAKYMGSPLNMAAYDDLDNETQVFTIPLVARSRLSGVLSCILSPDSD
jgi:hypothetical protein